MPGGGASGGAPEEGPVGDGESGTVALGGDARGGATRGVQSEDGLSVGREDLAVHVGVEAAHRKHRPQGVIDPVVECSERRLAERDDVLGRLVEYRIVSVFCSPVVEFDGVLEAPCGHSEFALEFFDGFADGGELGRWKGALVDVVVHDQVDLAAVVDERSFANDGLVGVLVDEALPETVDHEAPEETLGHREGQYDAPGVHANRFTACGQSHADSPAIVTVGSHGPTALRKPGCVFAHHLAVADEAPGAEDHATPCPVGAFFPLVGRHGADNPASLVQDEGFTAYVGFNSSGRALDGPEETAHELNSSFDSLLLDGVAPRSRRGDVRKGMGAFASRVRQTVVGGRIGTFAVERFLERNALADEPVEVLYALIAENSNLALIGVGSTGGH